MYGGRCEMHEMMIRPNRPTGEQAAYAAGSFAQSDDTFIVYQAGGISPLGNVICCPQSDYTVEVRPDGYSRSSFAGMEVTSPLGFAKAWYIRDQETGDVWSPFLNPVCEKSDEYELRYQPGQVSVYSLHHKIACTLTIATVSNHPCELWHIKLENRSARDRTVTFTTYLEPSLAQSMESKYLESERALLMRRRLDSIELDKADGAAQDLVMVHSSTLIPTRYQNEKSMFLGEKRTLRNPAHVEINDSIGIDGDIKTAITSQTVEIELPLEGSAEFAFCFGLANGAERAIQLARSFGTIQQVNKAISDSQRRWRELCSGTQIKTCDKTLDALINTWLPYEAYAAWMSERGKTRMDPARVADILKGVYAISSTAPELCRDCAISFAAGLTILGCYSPDARSLVSIPPHETLWLTLATAAYIAETGDFSVLDQDISLKDGPSLTLAEHCRRAIGLCLNSHSETDEFRDMLLEKAIRLWMIIAGDDGELGEQLEELKNRRQSEIDEHSEMRILPRRVRYFQSVSHSLTDGTVQKILQNNIDQAEWNQGDAGTSAMLYCSLVESVLGITATAEGLTLSPALPAAWHECSIIRKYRGDVYNITVKRSGVGSGRSISLVVDGEPVLGNMLPYFGDGNEHFVEATVS